MIPDSPAPDAAPTRRSSRATPAPVQASESAGSPRSDLRRGRRPGTLATDEASDPLAPRPAGLRSRPHNVPLTDADAEALSGAGLDSPRQTEPAGVAAESATPQAPLTRRARRATAAPSAAVLEPAAEAVPETPAADDAPVPETPVADDAPVADTPVASETPGDGEQQTPTPEAEGGDLFEHVVRTFGATGETPTRTRSTATAPSRAASASAKPGSAASGHTAARRVHVASGRKVAATAFSVGVMGIVGLLAVGMTTPVEAVAAASGGQGPTASIVALADVEPTANPEDDIQAYVAPAEASTGALSREEGYSAVSMTELAVEAGVREVAATYVNNTSAAVQYPFAVGVPISSPYGMRWGRMHEGVDFAPGGQGAEIHAVADGIVRIATEAGGAYGVHVVIDSIVDGELVSTNYAHMQYGSLRVEAGQVIKLGDVVGTVGTTGHSTGPHLHFEVLLNGKTPTEPMAWLAAHNVPSTVVTVPEAPITVDQ